MNASRTPRATLPRLLAASAALLVLPACATKGDLRNVRTELTALADQQEELLAAIQRQSSITQDSLRGTTNQLFEIRGSVNQQLARIQQELSILREENAQLARSIAALREEIERLARRPPSPGPAAQQPGQAVTGGGEVADLYNAAIQQFNLGSLTTARIAFEELVDLYPNDPLAPEAQFMLGDILERQDDPEGAIEAFELIPNVYPDARIVPDALWRVALLHIEEGRRPEAREALRRIIEEHPQSLIAPTAAERLREIGPGR